MSRSVVEHILQWSGDDAYAQVRRTATVVEQNPAVKWRRQFECPKELPEPIKPAHTKMTRKLTASKVVGPVLQSNPHSTRALARPELERDTPPEGGRRSSWNLSSKAARKMSAHLEAVHQMHSQTDNTLGVHAQSCTQSCTQSCVPKVGVAPQA